MPDHILDGAVVVVAGTTFTSKARSIAINVEADTQEITNFGSGGWKQHLGSLKSWNVDTELLQGFGTGEADPILYSLVGTTVTVDFRPASGTVTTTNPKFTGSAILTAYTPISGSVGDAHVARIALQGTGALTRGTS